MGAVEREQLVGLLAQAFGAASDFTPDATQPQHVLLPALELAEPWQPSPTRALTIWRNWPQARPDFYVDTSVVGETHEAPRSSSQVYVLGESWRQFSFQFPWNGRDDPVLAVQRWLTRFVVERS